MWRTIYWTEPGRASDPCGAWGQAREASTGFKAFWARRGTRTTLRVSVRFQRPRSGRLFLQRLACLDSLALF